VSLLDLYDDRLTVVTGAGGAAWRTAVEDLAADGLPIQVVQLGRDVLDPDGVAAARYGVGTSAAVLVRPDGHVAARLERTHLPVDALLSRAVDRALGRDEYEGDASMAG
jgi:hypothetical protein